MAAAPPRGGHPPQTLGRTDLRIVRHRVAAGQCHGLAGIDEPADIPVTTATAAAGADEQCQQLIDEFDHEALYDEFFWLDGSVTALTHQTGSYHQASVSPDGTLLREHERSVTGTDPYNYQRQHTVTLPDGRTVSQWPLAALMIGMTVLALWSLGQNLVFVAETTPGA